MRKLCHVPSDGQNGGLGLFWKADCNLHVQTFSPNHIDAHIISDNQPPCRITSFYRRPKGHRKHKSWSLLQHLHARAFMSWVCLGNFYEILQLGEKQGGNPKPLAPMLAFKETLLHCGLKDLGYQGYPFTWRNDRPGDTFVEVRLDRACASTEWKGQFPLAKVLHLWVSYSYHNPILLNTHFYAQQGRTRHKHLYQIEEHWVAHQGCEDVIREA